MSAGAFTNAFYPATYGAFTHPIRVQPETLLAAVGTQINESDAGPADNPISAQVGKSTRALGLHARVVFLKLAGTPPTGYVVGSKVRLPAVDILFYAACVKGATVNYLGTTWTVTGRRAEVVR